MNPHLSLATPDEVIAWLREFCQPLPPERVPLETALGRILRERVCASDDDPPFDRSAMDGFAVRVDDTASQFRCVDDLRAGDWRPRQIQFGECVRIATGAALPGDGLRVIMKEDTESQETSVRVIRRDPARHIRYRGEAARVGQTLVNEGTRLQPGALALLASIGHTHPLVTRQPITQHLATGDEIVPPDQNPGPGQVRDANSTLVRAFLNRWDIAPFQSRIAENTTRLTPAVAQADLLLISGGASVGEYDCTRRLLADLGYTLRIAGTRTRPGKPLLLAENKGQLAFGLPGNPLSHFVCLHLYVRVALEAWSGLTPSPIFHRGALAATLACHDQARETFWPAIARPEAGSITLTPLPWSSSGDLTPLATANALIRVPPGPATRAAGSDVEFVLTDTRL